MTLFRALSKLAAIALGLAILAYAALVIINWNDVPPSEIAREFATSIDRRPTVADEENAYLFAMGFATSPDGDPKDIGQRRRSWYAEQVAMGILLPRDDPFEGSLDRLVTNSDTAKNLASKCQQLGTVCLDLVAIDTIAATEWLDDEQWVLDRYIEMIVHDAYSEAIPQTSLWPMPDFGDIGYGQRLLMISAMISARNGDRSHVIALLEADLQFWRMVLANSDLLITKMISAAYVRNHFVNGNRVLRELHKSVRTDAIPQNWLIEISEAEKSLERSLIGEWRFIHNQYQSIEPDMEYIPTAKSADGATFLETVSWRLMLPLFQAQDSSNQIAAMLQNNIQLFDVPYIDVPLALGGAETSVPNMPKPYSRAYNVAGDLYFPAINAYRHYFVRTTDLEGVRRAAVLATEIRDREISAELVPEYITASKLTDPYTDEAFDWDSATDEIVFRGLSERDDGIYRLRY